MESKRKLSFIYRIFVIASLSMGIILNLTNTNSIIFLLSYYTLQSNIICLITFVLFFILDVRGKFYKNNIYYLIKGAIVIAILVTAIIYQIALAPNDFQMGPTSNLLSKQVANVLVHIVSPLMVLFDYIFFDIKGRFKKYYPVIWLFLPSQYITYVYTYQLLGGRFYSTGGSRKFAYFFLDYTLIGYKGVVLSIIVISIMIVLLGYILVFIDSKLAKKRKIK